MKVLMFGWEFPPHMSGGLGTACLGLTNSLIKKNVEILFVVPKLHGDELAGTVTFINASRIKPNACATDKKQEVDSIPDANEDPVNTSKEAAISLTHSKSFSRIEVPSGLLPYRSVNLSPGSRLIEHWNYSFRQQISGNNYPPINTNADVFTDVVKTSDGIEKESEGFHSFSGAYGDDLFLEVQLYAEVAVEIAKRFSFDVIHAHDWMTYPAAVAAMEVSKKPMVVHVHSTEYDRSGENTNKHIEAIELEGLKKARRIITVSTWTKNILISKYKIKEAKVHVVHNGVSIANVQKIKFNSPIESAPIVTFVGRITYQKGPLFFVHAAFKVLAKVPDVHFVVVGSGDLLPLMIETVATYGMSSRFHFTGFASPEEVQKIWSISSVYVMPSVSEPFGITPLEAAQAGVPVIISKQSGVAEVMPDAIAVDFWNISTLASSICGVLKYNSLARTLKTNSKSRTKKVTWNKAAEKVVAIYKHVIRQKQRK